MSVRKFIRGIHCRLYPVMKCPYKLIEVVHEECFEGYIYRRELIDISDYEFTADTVTVQHCYDVETGVLIGSESRAILLHEAGLVNMEKTDDDDLVATIGYSKENDLWCGWPESGLNFPNINIKVFPTKDEAKWFVREQKKKGDERCRRLAKMF